MFRVIDAAKPQAAVGRRLVHSVIHHSIIDFVILVYFIPMVSQRYKLTVSYRGTHYHGWQRQPAIEGYQGEAPPEGEGIPTIQEKLSRAIGGVVGHPVTVIGSSRTDAGVHAKGQIAHFDTTQQHIPIDGLRRAVNHQLPGDILIRDLQPVGPRFHAIRSTLSKRYQYFIWNSHDRPVFFNDLAWHRWQELDTAKMSHAAAMLVGEHDFASFARPGHGRENTVRTVTSCDLSVRSPRIVFGIEGTGFLWNMVRIIVGTLVQVGVGRFAPEEIQTMLAAKDRQSAGPTAPPHGLFLQWIRTSEGESQRPGESQRSEVSGQGSEEAQRSEVSGQRSGESQRSEVSGQGSGDSQGSEVSGQGSEDHRPETEWRTEDGI